MSPTGVEAGTREYTSTFYGGGLGLIVPLQFFSCIFYSDLMSFHMHMLYQENLTLIH